MKTLRNYSNKTLLGYHEGEPIFLTAPSWDCGWYWGFGYIGNRNCHYHIDGLPKLYQKNLHDALVEHLGVTFIVRPSQRWQLAELFQTFYHLKTTAEVLGRGGSHLASNLCQDIIKNPEETARINEIVLPAIFDEIYKILEGNYNNTKLFLELFEIDEAGNTTATVEFMKSNQITPDDLVMVVNLSKQDRSRIHSYYWKDYHSKKSE